MKRFLYFPVHLVICLSLAACGGGHNHGSGHIHSSSESHEGHDHAVHDQDHEPAVAEAVAEHSQGENFIEMCPEEAAAAGITTAIAGSMQFYSSIPAVGRVQAMQGDVMTVTAKNEGFVFFGTKPVVSGTAVKAGESLAVISGQGMAQSGYAETVSQATIEYNTSKSNYERIKLLYPSGLATIQNLQESESAFRLAELRLNNLQRDFEGNGLKVTAPSSGYINDVYVSQGDYAAVGQALFTVSKNSMLMLSAEVSPEYMLRLSKVVSANFRQSASGEYLSVADMGGKVLSVGRNVDANTMLVPVAFSIPYASTLVPGAFAEIALLLDEGAEGVVIPKEAIMEDFGHTFVYVHDEHGYERRYVTPGGNNGREVLLLSGVSEGDEVVVTGAARLKLVERLSGASGEAAAHAGHSH